MGRTGGALYAGGASLALLWLALPHPSGVKDLPLLITLMPAFAGAAIMWFWGERLNQVAYHVFVALGVVLISAAILFSGRSGTPFVLFYLWSNLYAWYFFARRAAVAHLAMTGICYALVLAVRDPVGPGRGESHGVLPVLGPSPARWLIVVGTATITSLLVAFLHERVKRLISRLTEERNFVSSVVETTPTLVIIFDLERHVQGFNRACAELTGYSADEVRGTEISQLLFAPEELEYTTREWNLVLEVTGPHHFDAHIITRSGERRMIAWSVVLGRDASGAPDHVIATGVDVTERERSEEALRARAAREAAVAELGREALRGLSVSQLVDSALDMLSSHLYLDVDRCEVWEPVAFGEELELTAARGALEERVSKLTIPSDTETEPGFALRADGPVIVADYAAETRFTIPPGVAGDAVTSGLTVAIPGPRTPLGVLSAHARRASAFTEDDALFMASTSNVLGAAMARWHAEEAVRHNALHDPLTGLPNRALFLDRLRHVLARRRPEVRHASVMFMDIDNFKLINDSLGHDAGDRLLKAIASRIQATLRLSDTVARFGGDEFVMLCEEVGDGRDALVIAERVQKALAEPFHIDDETHFLSASIGVAVASGRYEDADTLLGDADAAMYGAKERGHAHCELFDDAMRTKVLSRLRMENAMRGVLERDELRVFYQPIVSVKDGSLRGLEALMRWNHSGLGPVSPIEFIPIAEETGLIVPLGAWVIEEACRQSRLWSEELGIRTPPISVNLSPRQVSDAGLVSTVRNALEQSGLEPDQLALEITERVLVSEAESPWNTIEALKRLGVKLLLDDFGTGYSSLSYLKRFPVDALKIDRSFIDGLGDEAEDSAIVEAVVGMARALDIRVVAEGVETERQVACLRELGCELAQGFLFGRPREAATTMELLRPLDPIPNVVPLSPRIPAA